MRLVALGANVNTKTSGIYMKVEFNLTKKDFEKGSRFYQKNSKVGKLQKKVGLIIVFVITSFFTIKNYDNNLLASILFFLFMLMFTYVFYFSFLFFSNKIVFWKMSKPENSRGVIGNHVIELTEDALIESTEYNISQHKWITVENIFDTEEYLFIFITGLGGHAIPKLSFNDKQHYSDFYNTLIKYSKK